MALSSGAALLVCFLALLSACLAVKVNPSDASALLSAKAAFTSYGKAKLSTWATNQDSSKWYGVKFNSNGRATSVVLSNVGIRGSISSALGRLSSLVTLDLSYNAITGSIPTSLANLKSLKTLYLQFNNLTRAFPNGLAHLPKLVSLRVDHNKLSGAIARNYQSGSIRLVNYFGNYFSGSSVIKKQIKKLCKVKIDNTHGMNLANNCLAVRYFNEPCFAKQRASGPCKAYCNAYNPYGVCGGHGNCVQSGSGYKCVCDAGRKLSSKDKFVCV